jgi:NADPH:quinone reductase
MFLLALVNTPHGPTPIELREIREPSPADDEALVNVHAFFPEPRRAEFLCQEQGWVPGQDIAGVVVRQAASGEGPAAGTGVVALVEDSGWAERVAVPNRRMAVLPDEVSFPEAATLPVAGLTALRTLRHGALVGRRMLISGAAGGVGTLAVQSPRDQARKPPPLLGGRSGPPDRRNLAQPNVSGCETSLALSAIGRALIMSPGPARPAGLALARTGLAVSRSAKT